VIEGTSGINDGAAPSWSRAPNGGTRPDGPCARVVVRVHWNRSRNHGHGPGGRDAEGPGPRGVVDR
jgi:hypothetical protein